MNACLRLGTRFLRASLSSGLANLAYAVLCIFSLAICAFAAFITYQGLRVAGARTLPARGHPVRTAGRRRGSDRLVPFQGEWLDRAHTGAPSSFPLLLSGAVRLRGDAGR